MKVFYHHLFITTLFFGHVFAQADTAVNEKSDFYKNEIGIAVGFNAGNLKDQPFTYWEYAKSGVLIGLNLSHRNRSGKNIFEGSINFSSGKLIADAFIYKFVSGNTILEPTTNFNTTYNLANFRLSYLTDLSRNKKNKFHVYFGGQYQTEVQYLAPLGKNDFGFIGTHGIALKGWVTYNIKEKHSIRSTLAIPVFQIVDRPLQYRYFEKVSDYEAAKKDKMIELLFTGKPTTINTYFAFDSQTTYKYSLTSRLDLNLKYSLCYQSLSDIRDFKELQHQIKVGVNLNY
jgi:hypothetical protein